jgi:hypothetical protein
MIPMEAEPFLIRHAEAQRLLGLGSSHYFGLVRAGRIKVVGRGRLSRALYGSVKEYVRDLVAEAEAKAGELV